MNEGEIYSEKERRGEREKGEGKGTHYVCVRMHQRFHFRTFVPHSLSIRQSVKSQKWNNLLAANDELFQIIRNPRFQPPWRVFLFLFF